MLSPVNLTGILIPCDPFNNNFVFLNSKNGLLLPVFSNLQQYNEAAKWADFESAKCIKITDHEGFIKAISEAKKKFEFKIAFDPYLNEQKNTCFKVIEVTE